MAPHSPRDPPLESVPQPYPKVVYTAQMAGVPSPRGRLLLAGSPYGQPQGSRAQSARARPPAVTPGAAPAQPEGGSGSGADSARLEHLRAKFARASLRDAAAGASTKRASSARATREEQRDGSSCHRQSPRLSESPVMGRLHHARASAGYTASSEHGWPSMDRSGGRAVTHSERRSPGTGQSEIQGSHCCNSGEAALALHRPCDSLGARLAFHMRPADTDEMSGSLFSGSPSAKLSVTTGDDLPATNCVRGRLSQILQVY
ncbi:hypothetical protein T492DRAFT_1102542 [Pavlovales sp. CCMP2436]|nr:hypothetical protein T492DRAFT_1102542 [Pavlovales sp. CCMP2436]